MATYGISGVWKDSNNVIIAYAFHTDSTSRAVKRTKAEAIKLLEAPRNSAVTWIWDYATVRWKIGEKVKVDTRGNVKYLRSDPDNTLKDNLGHLIDYTRI